MAKKRGGGPRLSFWESLFVHSDFRVVGHEMLDVYEKDIPAPFYPKMCVGQRIVDRVEAVREHRGPKATCRLCRKNGTAHRFEDQFSDKGKLAVVVGCFLIIILIGVSVGLLHSLAK